MYLDQSFIKKNGKTYKRYLLRDSFRKDGKVKHRTYANLSHCSEQEIQAIKLALKHKDKLEALVNVKEDIQTVQGPSVGAVWLLREIAHRLHIDAALGYKRQGKLALWQVIARTITQGSRCDALRLSSSHAVHDILHLDSFDKDDLYHNLDWLAQEQEKIEKRLYRHRHGKGGNTAHIFLYDITSSCPQGVDKKLGDWRYNRDGTQGKQQVVIGFLCDIEGAPVSVRVFSGHPKDTTTVSEQLKTVVHQFGAKEITFVGDKGLLRGPQFTELTNAGCHYITSITQPEIHTLLSEKTIQMSLFDEQITEVEDESKGVRYILRKNPLREKGVQANRRKRIAKVQAFVDRQNEYLGGTPPTSPEVALQRVNEMIEKYKLSGFMSVQLSDCTLSLTMNAYELSEIEKLDGCYVIKTDLKAWQLHGQRVHDRYKELSKVKQAFRTMNRSFLDERPIYDGNANPTCGYMLVVMLSYMLVRELNRCWKALNVLPQKGLSELSRLCSCEVQVKGKARYHTIPQPHPSIQQLFAAAEVSLPPQVLQKVNTAATKKSSET